VGFEPGKTQNTPRLASLIKDSNTKNDGTIGLIPSKRKQQQMGASACCPTSLMPFVTKMYYYSKRAKQL